MKSVKHEISINLKLHFIDRVISNHKVIYKSVENFKRAFVRLLNLILYLSVVLVKAKESFYPKG